MNVHIERFNRTIQEEFVDYHSHLLINPDNFNRKLIDYLIFYNTRRVHYAFQNRLPPVQFIKVNQWEWVKKQMIKNKETRRAVILIVSPGDMKEETKDFPCTTALQFLIRENRLHLICNMRSNDLVLGFTYDVATFTLYQEKMLIELKKYYPNLKMGKYFHLTGSLHIYKKYYEMIKEVIKDKDNNFKISMPHMDNLKEIKALQYNENIIRTNSTKKLKKLTDKFCIWCQNVLLNKINY